MKLDITTGDVTFENLMIGGFTTESEFLQLFDGRHRESVFNGDYRSYNVVGLEYGEFAMNVYFFKDKLNLISIGLGNKYIFPPFSITEEEQTILKERLAMLGGEAQYNWGQVFFSADPRSGSVSIGIRYV